MKYSFFKFVLLVLIISNTLYIAGCEKSEESLYNIPPDRIIAHRGYHHKHGGVENSIQSFVDAIEAGFYGAETDVRQTKDGILVLSHDENYNKKVIKDSEYNDIKSIPTLTELLNIIKTAHDFKLIIEIKDARIEDVIALMDSMHIDINSQIIFFSFSQTYCSDLIALDRQLNVAYLNGDLSPNELKDSGYSGMAFHYSLYKNSPLIEEAKGLGLTTYAWTVNNPRTGQELIEQGCDFIITDMPR